MFTTTEQFQFCDSSNQDNSDSDPITVIKNNSKFTEIFSVFAAGLVCLCRSRQATLKTVPQSGPCSLHGFQVENVLNSFCHLDIFQSILMNVSLLHSSSELQKSFTPVLPSIACYSDPSGELRSVRTMFAYEELTRSGAK